MAVGIGIRIMDHCIGVSLARRADIGEMAKDGSLALVFRFLLSVRKATIASLSR